MTLPNKFHASENISGFAKQQVLKRCQPHLGSNFKQRKIYRGFIIKCFGASLSTTGGRHQSSWGRARQSSVLTVGSEFSQIEIRHSNYKEREHEVPGPTRSFHLFITQNIEDGRWDVWGRGSNDVAIYVGGLCSRCKDINAGINLLVTGVNFAGWVSLQIWRFNPLKCNTMKENWGRDTDKCVYFTSEQWDITSNMVQHLIQTSY